MLYVFSIYGMYLFTEKMYALTKMRASSLNKGDPDKFNEQQRKLLYTTTKYLTLLSIAMLSTWISGICSIPLNVIYSMDNQMADKSTIIDILLLLACIDSMVNIICLYLQFQFNHDYYDKYCTCFGKICTYFLMKRISNEIEKERHEISQNGVILPSISNISIPSVPNIIKVPKTPTEIQTNITYALTPTTEPNDHDTTIDMRSPSDGTLVVCPRDLVKDDSRSTQYPFAD